VAPRGVAEGTSARGKVVGACAADAEIGWVAGCCRVVRHAIDFCDADPGTGGVIRRARWEGCGQVACRGGCEHRGERAKILFA